MKAIEAFILARSYVKKSLAGLGAVKGSPCTIKEINFDSDLNTVLTFAWRDKDDVEFTQDAIINRGLKGESIVDCSVNEETGAIVFVTSDGKNLTPIVIPITETVTKNKKDIAALNEVVKTLGGSIVMKIVDSLPESDIKTNAIYLKKTTTENKYDQFVWTVDDAGVGSWASLGSTELDLSAYFLKENIVSEFAADPSDYKVPSEKLVKDNFELRPVHHYMSESDYLALVDSGEIVEVDDYLTWEE